MVVEKDIDNEPTVDAIPIEWLVKHSEFGVIDRWIMAREKENETN